MDIAGALHVLEDVILQFIHRRKRERDVLILLDIADDFCRLCPLGKVDQIRLLDDSGNTILDEGQVGQIYTWIQALVAFVIIVMKHEYALTKERNAWRISLVQRIPVL